MIARGILFDFKSSNGCIYKFNVRNSGRAGGHQYSDAPRLGQFEGREGKRIIGPKTNQVVCKQRSKGLRFPKRYWLSYMKRVPRIFFISTLQKLEIKPIRNKLSVTKKWLTIIAIINFTLRIVD